MLNQDLEEKVRFLASPGALGGRASARACETHMSWVFLTEDLVFKLKKPVTFSYLDFSTLAAREAACREELRLNQDLAPEVYLRLARLTREGNGSLMLDGQGEILDWLVVMARLPNALMLDARIAAKAVTKRDIEALATTLMRFYTRVAPAAACSPDDYVARFQAQLALDRAVLTDSRLSFDHSRALMVLERLQSCLEALGPALQARAETGRLVEGHGDLRPEHICLGETIRIIDRLEFNRELRIVDPFDELAFLGLECAMLTAAWIGPFLIEHARKALQAPPPDQLVSLYAALRASLRARLSLAHLYDAAPRKPETWAPRAMRYLGEIERILALIAQERRD
jgi:aminoglycoside phosphotransferase family enzyme